MGLPAGAMTEIELLHPTFSGVKTEETDGLKYAQRAT